MSSNTVETGKDEREREQEGPNYLHGSADCWLDIVGESQIIDPSTLCLIKWLVTVQKDGWMDGSPFMHAYRWSKSHAHYYRSYGPVDPQQVALYKKCTLEIGPFGLHMSTIN
jgi:hypothetical protein